LEATRHCWRLDALDDLAEAVAKARRARSDESRPSGLARSEKEDIVMLDHRGFAIAIALVAFAGCRNPQEEKFEAQQERREAARAQQEANEEAAEATEAEAEAEQAWREEAARYQKSVMGELVDLDRELVDLRLSAAKLGGDDRAEADALIGGIEDQRRKLQMDLDALGTSTAAEHAPLKERIQHNLEALDDTLEQAANIVNDKVEEG
jgi:Zn-dependent M32 family carboxypeptidase